MKIGTLPVIIDANVSLTDTNVSLTAVIKDTNVLPVTEPRRLTLATVNNSSYTIITVSYWSRDTKITGAR